MDSLTHKRFLDYRDRHAYFGRQVALLGMAAFEAADREHRELAAKEGRRDDDEEARFEELSKLLVCD